MEPRTVVLIGGDLMAKSRVQDAAARAGVEVVSVSPEKASAALSSADPHLVIVDLDGLDPEVLEQLTTMLTPGDKQPRVVGFFSHVDDKLRERALSAGIEPLPRGRFWRSLSELIG
jgi:hypothetical protein